METSNLLKSISKGILTENTKEVKKYSDTYLYKKGDYDTKLFKFIMSAERVDKNAESFKDIIFDVKRRQVTNSLVEVLKSNKVILLTHPEPLPRAFKVFAAKDVKTDKQLKVFIDVTGVINNDSGRYSCTNRIDILIAYLLSAMHTFIYNADPSRIVNRTKLYLSGATCYASMIYYIIDYLRVGAVDNIKGKVMYMASNFFQVSMMGREEYSESVINTNKKISGISDREISMIEVILETHTNPYKDINTFVNTICAVIRADATKFKLDPFIDKWMKLFGVGTQFGTELYTAFATMILDAYSGAYLNNQKTIEKVCGRNLVEFTEAVFEVGKGAIK